MKAHSLGGGYFRRFEDLIDYHELLVGAELMVWDGTPYITGIKACDLIVQLRDPMLSVLNNFNHPATSVLR